jgi:hypothetical protein
MERAHLRPMDNPSIPLVSCPIHGHVYDWSEEGIEEDKEPGLLRQSRIAQTLSSSPDHEPIKICRSRSLSSLSLRRPIRSLGSGSPSSPPGLGSSRSSWERPVLLSVRTQSSPRAPSFLAARSVLILVAWVIPREDPTIGTPNIWRRQSLGRG